MNKISFIFAIIVASASCYDFLKGDRLFEQPNNRFKRTVKGRPHCCGNDFSGKPVIFLGEITEECLPQDAPNENDVKAQINMYICVGDCIAKKEGTVQDGEVNREKVMEFLRRHDQDEYRIQMYEDKLDKCISEANIVQEKVSGKVKCDLTAVTLLRCLYRELIENCPEEKQNVDQEKKCGEFKQTDRFTFDHVFQ